VRAEKQDGITRIRNYYDGNEFIKSTDPYFRPVDQTTAPDGTIYITDLYHGIIQEATWSRPGTYLRKRIEQRYFDWSPAEDNAVLRLARERLLGTTSPAVLPSAAAQQGLIQIVRDFCENSNAICEKCHLPDLVRQFVAADQI
jgi:hypothetical protein